jgi:hypothetical protein
MATAALNPGPETREPDMLGSIMGTVVGALLGLILGATAHSILSRVDFGISVMIGTSSGSIVVAIVGGTGAIVSAINRRREEKIST